MSLSATMDANEKNDYAPNIEVDGNVETLAMNPTFVELQKLKEPSGTSYPNMIGKNLNQNQDYKLFNNPFSHIQYRCSKRTSNNCDRFRSVVKYFKSITTRKPRTIERIFDAC